jgi:hypothetical protein
MQDFERILKMRTLLFLALLIAAAAYIPPKAYPALRFQDKDQVTVTSSSMDDLVWLGTEKLQTINNKFDDVVAGFTTSFTAGFNKSKSLCLDIVGYFKERLNKETMEKESNQ